MTPKLPQRAGTLRANVFRTGNRIVRTIAGRRIYALLRHRGRRSGREYSTPVAAWKAGSSVLVPMPWGTTTDWTRNVLAGEGCSIQIRGRWYLAREPQILSREAALSYIPPAARAMARLLPIDSYMKLRTEQPGA
jgi:deazaflavin-dependent oxidoreductase (nitroreductase family)